MTSSEPELQRDELPLLDLASRAVGGGVVSVTDDFFAGVENLLTAAPAVHDPGAFGLRGKVYDGWETRRRRPAPGTADDLGADHVVVRLGAAGTVARVVVDTAFFTGNYPPRVSVDGATLPGYPGPAEVEAAAWFPLVPRRDAAGGTANTYDVTGTAARRRVTHVRLTIHPDGGVARLRVLGRPVPDPALLTGTVDVAAAVHGGAVVACSNLYYASPDRLLLPGRAATTGEGWENARRRDGGHDFVTVRLAAPARVRRVEVDAGRFIGNAPGHVRVLGRRHGPGTDAGTDAGWTVLVATTATQPDTLHLFAVDDVEGSPEVDEVRLEVFPDGGLSRLRVHGELTAAGRAAVGARWFDTADPEGVTRDLHACLDSPAWVAAMVAGRPHGTGDAWLAAAAGAYDDLPDDEVSRALAAHPRIGRSPSGASTEAALSRREQAAVSEAADDLKAAIAEGNAAYEERFGRVFLIRAAGRGPDEVLAALVRRLGNDDATELAEAREQLRQIMLLRLAGLLGAPAPAFAPGRLPAEGSGGVA